MSDPERRAQYDRGFAQIFVEVKEDPVEAYKREFKRKRREREKQEREAELARKQNIYDMRWANIPIAVFAAVWHISFENSKRSDWPLSTPDSRIT